VAEKIQQRATEINAKLLAEERELNAIVQQVALSETKKEENNNDRKEDKKETSGNQKKKKPIKVFHNLKNHPRMLRNNWLRHQNHNLNRKVLKTQHLKFRQNQKIPLRQMQRKKIL